MLCKEVSPHLIRGALFDCHLLLDKHTVADEVISGEALLGPGLISRIVEDVDGRLSSSTRTGWAIGADP